MYITFLSLKTLECLSKLFEQKKPLPGPGVVLRSAKISASLVPRNSVNAKGSVHGTKRTAAQRRGKPPGSPFQDQLGAREFHTDGMGNGIKLNPR